MLKDFLFAFNTVLPSLTQIVPHCLLLYPSVRSFVHLFSMIGRKFSLDHPHNYIHVHVPSGIFAGMLYMEISDLVAGVITAI